MLKLLEWHLVCLFDLEDSVIISLLHFIVARKYRPWKSMIQYLFLRNISIIINIQRKNSSRQLICSIKLFNVGPNAEIHVPNEK